MGMKKIVKATLKVISLPEIDTKKNYKAERAMVDLTHRHYMRPLYRIWDHQVTAGDHQVPVRIFSPKPAGHFPVILYFHGGGWVTGDIDSYDRVCSDLSAATGCKVVSVDYRLAPEYRFPAGLEDCYAVAREVFLHWEGLGAPPSDITLMGDSAGGNLAAAVSLMAKEKGEFMPTRQILLYPSLWNDHNPETSIYESVRENGEGYLLTSRHIEDYMELYQSSPQDRENPYFAPLLARDLSGQPRTLMITAQYDPLRDEGEDYARRLEEAGVEVVRLRMSGAIHGFFSHARGSSQVKRAYRYINHFLARGEQL